MSARGIEALDGAGMRFRLLAPRGEAVVALPLVGRHQVENALAAAAVGLEFGLSLEEVARGLSAVNPAHGRLEMHDLGVLRLLDDTYNAAPASCLAALAALGEIAPPERRVAVLGDMFELGPAAEAGHREVGAAAGRLPVRLLLAVGPQSAWTAAAAGHVALHVRDRDAAVRALESGLRPGDTVLLKGSRAMGMEDLTRALRDWASRHCGERTASGRGAARGGPPAPGAGPGGVGVP